MLSEITNDVDAENVELYVVDETDTKIAQISVDGTETEIKPEETPAPETPAPETPEPETPEPETPEPETISEPESNEQHTTNWGPIGAALVLATFPTLIVYVFLSKRIQSSFMEGAIKG